MNLTTFRLWLPAILVFLAADFGRAQENESVTVPTPSFSNPGTRAETREVPATGTGLRPVQPVKVPGRSANKKKKANPEIDQGSLLDPTDDIHETSKGTALEQEKKNPPPPPAPSREVPRTTTTQDIRVEMLERIADQLSLRMRMIKEREEAITQRERSLVEREEKAARREELMLQMEESLLLREEVVRRREKLPPPQAWRGDDAPGIVARYATVLDGATMQFYHSKNGTDPTPVASTQKLMTALVICGSGGLDEIMTIPKAATLVEPTKVGIKTDERYTRRQLLTALLVKSGNDLAAALAIDNAGSVEAFTDKMNAMGKRIGLMNSNFKTPHGLPAKGQFSCARDIGIVAFEAYQVPEIREIIKLRSYTFTFNDGTTRPLINTNRLLRSYEPCNGMKTGFTYAAGRCLVSSANVGDQHRISVVINSDNTAVWKDSQNLLEWSLGLDMLGPLEGDEYAGTDSGGPNPL